MSMAKSQKRKRISYNIPPANYALELLQLPEEALDQISFDPRPRLYSARTGKRLPDVSPFILPPGAALQSAKGSLPNKSSFQSHPKHCLGISSLGLDLSTAILSDTKSGDAYFQNEDPRPGGILYSAGRDGLVAAWDLSLPTRKRKRKVGSGSTFREARRERCVDLGIWEDDATAEASDSSEEEADPFADQQDYFASSPQLPPKSKLPYEDRWELDTLQTSQALPKTTFRQSVHSHSDWINALVLCNLNQTIVTASSDQTIRAWNPHSADESLQPTLLGDHDDYVKTLTYSRHGSWVASGGFDRKIKVWDVEESRERPIVEFRPTSDVSSIYCLATNQKGALIASGSPEKTVRVWDPRSSKPQIARLNGHADNVRSILMSEDGKSILTASADSTIKLWSLAMSRCVHTFSHHCESVWSLFSSHPDLEVFYSGDRTGNVCKVDYEGARDISEGDCVLLCKDDDRSSTAFRYGRSPGINSIVAADHGYVWSASGTSSIHRWKDVPSLASRKTLHPLSSGNAWSNSNVAQSPPESSLPLLPEDDLPVASPSVPGVERRGVSFAPPSSIQKHSPITSYFSHRAQKPSLSGKSAARTVSGSSQAIAPTVETRYGIALDSLIPLGMTLPYIGVPVSRVDSRLTNGSLATLPLATRYPSNTQNSFGLAVSNSFRASSRILDSESAIDDRPRTAAEIAYEDRESAIDAVPLRLAPDDVIYGRKGLIHCEQLNDRRTVLTADTSGDIAVWDIVLCHCIGVFARDDLIKQKEKAEPNENNEDPGRSLKNLLYFVHSRIEQTGVVLQWASVDTRVGSLSVHLDESKCFNGETYVEQSGFDGLFAPDVLRISFAKIVLRNIFDSFLQSQLRKSALPSPISSGISTPENGRIHRNQAPAHISLNGISSAIGKGPLTSSIAMATPAATAVVRPSTADRSSRNVDRSLVQLHEVQETSQEQVTSSMSDAIKTPQSPTTSTQANGFRSGTITPAASSNGGFMQKFRLKSRKTTTDTPMLASASNGDEVLTTKLQSSDERETFFANLSSKTLQPPEWEEAPRIILPPELVYSIADETKVSGAWSVVQRGLAANTGLEGRALEACAPLWLLDFLLLGRSIPVEPHKITFVLSPWRSPADAGLPAMPVHHARLTANRLLRIAKVAVFVAEKLNLSSNIANTAASPRTDNVALRSPSHASLASQTSSLSSNFSASSPSVDPTRIEFLCNDIPLPASATLAGVRQVCYKRGGDLPLSYRLIAAPDAQTPQAI